MIRANLEKMTNFQYPVASITKSYARKINLQAYGGKAYESADFFESRNYSWFTEPAKSEVDEAATLLYEACRASVESQVAEFVATLGKPVKKEELEDIAL